MNHLPSAPRHVKAAIVLDNREAQALAEEAGLLLALLAQPPERDTVALGVGRLPDGRSLAVIRWLGFASPADCGWAACTGPRRFVEAWSMKLLDLSGVERCVTLKPGDN